MAGAGSYTGRFFLVLFTAGIARLFMRFCSGCGHPMGLHRGAAAVLPHVQPSVPEQSGATAAPTVPYAAPAAQWNGTVWQAWNAGGNRWMIWDGQAWR